MKFKIEGAPEEEKVVVGLRRSGDGGVALVALRPGGTEIWLVGVGADGQLHRYVGCQAVKGLRLDADGRVQLGEDAERLF